MARSPANEQPDPRQLMWDAMRACETGPWFTITDIQKVTGQNKETIRTYLKCLCAGDCAERREVEPGVVDYRLLGAPGEAAPRLRKNGSAVDQGGGSETMWRSMRMMPEFSPRDLAAHSTTPDVGVSESTAKTYCSVLLAAGYLRVVRPAKRGRLAVYRLIRNSGPKPPMIQRVKRVYDPNTSEIWAVETGA